ncbi:MAG TPA: hypothetical protein VG389_06430, partial [Myxococcota bacterium]|nr:hypothetical protein [Myxococcota bacterium]
MSTQVPTVADLFVLMDRWRSLPSYQLERRADIFFAPFLAGFVGSMEGVVIAPTIVPEFPVRQQDSNRTDKVDYVLFSADRTRVFFLELKTDVGSLRTEQNQYLAR